MTKAKTAQNKGKSKAIMFQNIAVKPAQYIDLEGNADLFVVTNAETGKLVLDENGQIIPWNKISNAN